MCRQAIVLDDETDQAAPKVVARQSSNEHERATNSNNIADTATGRAAGM